MTLGPALFQEKHSFYLGDMNPSLASSLAVEVLLLQVLRLCSYLISGSDSWGPVYFLTFFQGRVTSLPLHTLWESNIHTLNVRTELILKTPANE